MNLNRVIIVGRLTADPVKKTTPNGQDVVTFSIATSRKWKDKSGEQQEQAEFHNVVFWGKSALVIAQYAKKGTTMLVEGRLQSRTWDAKDGSKRKATEIIGETFQFGPKIETKVAEEDLSTDVRPEDLPF